MLRYDEANSLFHAEAVFFRNTLDNLIIRHSDGFRRNTGKFLTQGVEIEGGFRLGALRASGFYAYVTPDESETDSISAADKIQSGAFRHIAEHTLYLDATYTMAADRTFGPIEDLDMNLNARWESGFYDRDDVMQPAKIIVNTTLIAREILGPFDLSASIYNLFDEQYLLGDEVTSPVPQLGRSFLLGFATQF